MSKSATVSKLESLLARIRGRAAEPRGTTHTPAAGPVAAAPSPPVAAPPVAAAVAPPVVAAAPPPAVAPPVAREMHRSEAPVSVQVIQVDEATLPPPPMTSDADFVVDVEVVAATPPPPPMAEEPPAEEAPARAALESRERLSSVPPRSTEPPEMGPDAADDGPSLEHGEALADEEALAGEEVEGEPEDAPASSRRPVAPPPEERLAEIAFGTAEPQPPRHTPPPKSGRLPAPPSEFDADETGVREAVAISTQEDEAPEPSAPMSRPAALVPQAVRPNLGTAARVPDVIGAAQSFAPTTFLALLDASLSL